jgi:topoisomerase-4 subunit A
MIDLPGEERLMALTRLTLNQSLILTAGKRDMKLKPVDLEGYAGERGRRGKPLPRGFQRVERMIAGE